MLKRLIVLTSCIANLAANYAVAQASDTDSGSVAVSGSGSARGGENKAAGLVTRFLPAGKPWRHAADRQRPEASAGSQPAMADRQTGPDMGTSAGQGGAEDLMENADSVVAEAELPEAVGRGPTGPRSTAARAAKSPASELEQLQAALAKQQKVFEQQQQLLQQQAKALQALQARVDQLSGKTASPPPPGKTASPPPTGKAAKKTKGAPTPTAVAAASPQAPGGAPAAPTGVERPKSIAVPERPVGIAPDASQKPKLPELPRFSDTLGGVLTPEGKIMVEPSIEYAYAGNNRVFLDAFTFLPAIAVGLIDIRQVQRHTFVAAGSLRYGVFDNFEIGARVPFLYREDLQRSRPVSIAAGADETFTADGYGLGDIEFTTRYQINQGVGGWPVFVGNFSASFPTGTSPFQVSYVQAKGIPGALFPTELPTGVGYYSMQPSLTMLYPSDPAAFFLNLSYGANLEHQERVGNVDPGDAIGGYGGMSFSINDKSSFSLGYSQRFLFNSYISGTRIPGSQLTIGEFLVGVAYRFTKDTSMNINLSVGATPDAQDVKLTFRLPMYFQGLSGL